LEDSWDFRERSQQFEDDEESGGSEQETLKEKRIYFFFNFSTYNKTKQDEKK
jgi:hypothetical protein